MALRLCGDSAKWLALVNLPDKDVGNDYGWRFVLLVDSADVAVVRYATLGLVDSYAPDFRLFRSGVQYLLLAALGDEGGSWGLATYDVGPTVIADLGILDVGMPGDTDTGNDQSALASATVHHRMDGWRVLFQRRIVLRPNQDTRVEVQPRPGRFLVFHPTHDWQLDK